MTPRIASCGITGNVQSCRGEKQMTRQVPEADWLRISSPPSTEDVPFGMIAAKSFVKTYVEV
jgi:hypothetical protein